MMKKQHSIKLELLAIAISLLVVLISANEMIGKTVRLVHILTIVFGSISVGVSAGKLIEKVRRAKKDDANLQT